MATTPNIIDDGMLNSASEMIPVIKINPKENKGFSLNIFWN